MTKRRDSSDAWREVAAQRRDRDNEMTRRAAPIQLAAMQHSDELAGDADLSTSQRQWCGAVAIGNTLCPLFRLRNSSLLAIEGIGWPDFQDIVVELGRRGLEAELNLRIDDDLLSCPVSIEQRGGEINPEDTRPAAFRFAAASKDKESAGVPEGLVRALRCESREGPNVEVFFAASTGDLYVAISHDT